MKKIIFIRQAVPGGTDNYCKALYQMFSQHEYYRAEQIEDYPIIPSRLFHYYYKKKPLKNAIKNADIVHVNGYTAMGTVQALWYAKRMKKKVIYTAHWHPFKFLRHPLFGKLFFTLILKPTIKHCVKTVITINHDDTRFFQSFHKQVIQIPHWYKPEMQLRYPPKKQNMILFVGRINDPVKGIEHLYYLPKDAYEVHCVGKGNLKRKDFIQHINISNEELNYLYEQAALLVVPSKYEAFSYVALEALRCNTPVLMSQNVHIADHLGTTKGYQVFKYGNINEFLNKINETIQEKVDIREINEIFNPITIKQKYIQIYSQ